MANDYRSYTDDGLRYTHKRLYHRIYQRMQNIRHRDDTEKYGVDLFDQYTDKYKDITGGASPHALPPDDIDRYELMRLNKELWALDRAQTTTVKGAQSSLIMRVQQLGEGYKKLTAQEQSALWRYIQRATSQTQYDSNEVQAIIAMNIKPDTLHFGFDSSGILQLNAITVDGQDIRAGDFDQVTWNTALDHQVMKSNVNRAKERKYRETNDIAYRKSFIK